jgi:hypothetical protein
VRSGKSAFSRRYPLSENHSRVRNDMSGRAHASVQASHINQLIVPPPPSPPGRKLLVVAVVAVLLVVAAAGVAVWLDISARAGLNTEGSIPHSTSSGIPGTAENAPEPSGTTSTASKKIPSTTRPPARQDPPPTPTAAQYRISGPIGSGQFELTVSRSYDLDFDHSSEPGDGADIGLSCCDLHMTNSRPMMVLGVADEVVENCFDQQARSKIPVEQLSAQPTTVCVVTDQAHLATVHVKVISSALASSPKVSISYDLWQVD